MTERHLIVGFALMVVVLGGAFVMVLWTLVMLLIVLTRSCGTQFFVGSQGEPALRKVRHSLFSSPG